MTDLPTIFGNAMGEKVWLHDDAFRRTLRYGVFLFWVDYHNERYPNSPWHGVSGQIMVGSVPFGEFMNEGGREHKWLGTEAEVIAFLEAEARRIMRECFEIAGQLEASSCELLEPAKVRFRDG